MRHWFALSAIGHDRPGIVADLAHLIYECDCNLEDSSMTILGSEFAVLLLLSSTSAEAERLLTSGCKRLEWEKRLTVFFRPLDAEPIP
jgi:glycine cleavage system transcriptional repressor